MTRGAAISITLLALIAVALIVLLAWPTHGAAPSVSSPLAVSLAKEADEPGSLSEGMKLPTNRWRPVQPPLACRQRRPQCLVRADVT
jgi:hypothetical protein